MEVFGWIWIAFSPTLVGLILGGLFYLSTPNTTGKVGWVVIASLGIIAGAIWATKVKRKHGTIWFMSRNMATPELDGKSKATKEKENKE